jgi:phage-related protein
MKRKDKPLIWLHGEIKTPPLSSAARTEAGYLLRKLQMGELLSLPHSRPMPWIGSRCHELRIDDQVKKWRVVYRIDHDAIVPTASGGFAFMIPPQEEAYEERKEEAT